MDAQLQAPPIASGTRMTADEYFAMPESNLPAMLLDGEYIQLPGVTPEHQTRVFELAGLVKRVKPNGRVYIAPLDVLLDDSNIVQPDVFWIAENSATCAIINQRVRGAPDFVAEILSPGTQLYDRKGKFNLYEAHGTREYWLIHPTEQFVEVYTRADDLFRRVGVFGPEETIPSPLFGNVEGAEIFA